MSSQSRSPYLFDEFFSSGLEESVSPFLTKDSRKWGQSLSLKSALGAAFFWILAFACSFVNPGVAHFFLLFVYFFSGAPAIIATINDFKNFEINIDVLMTLAAFLAVAIGSPFEGALLLVLFELSHGMEESVSRKAKSALHNLNNLAPKFAVLLAEDETTYEKAVRDIEVGAKLLLRQGEILPLDGKILRGISSVNLVHLTGESIPHPVKEGDSVPAGARNLEAALTIQVTRIGAESTLSKIIQLIGEAQKAKPKVQRFLDRFSKGYASSIIGLTFIFAVGLPFVSSLNYFGIEGAIYRALAFMIAASPCALIIATPTAYLSAISSCARKGILLKGGITLDALASCHTVAFDKTGTLTTGELLCVGVEKIGENEINLSQAIAIAASLERQVVHPIASAICKLAAEKKVPLVEITEFKATPGYGLEAKIEKEVDVAIGLPEHIGEKLFKEKKILLKEWSQKSQAQGHGLALLSVGDALFGFRFSDQVRPQAKELIEKLKTKNHLSSVMLTGDHTENASFVGELLGIQKIFANLKPQDKLDQVATLSQKEGLAMVGDGINDAPALARATVGISMGKVGSATAVDASDVVLLNDDLAQLSWLFSHSKKTQTIVRQNLTLALGVICLATTPALLGLVPLWVAVLLHEGGTVLVGLNSLRLLK